MPLAALYHIGECHELNGDTSKAIKAWAKLAEDKEYRKQPLGASAINYLADYLTKNEKAAEAVKYYRQVAVDFRKENPEASRHAMAAAIHYYVRLSPGEPEYRKFYTDMGRFGHHPRDGRQRLVFRQRLLDYASRQHSSPRRLCQG